MSDKETLKFKIGLSCSSTRKNPQFKICINDVTYVTDVCKGKANNPEYFEFEVSVNEGDHILAIHLMNKLPTDTIKDDNSNIVEDLLLNIESIEIDEIGLESLLWTHSNYKPDYPQSYREFIIESGQELPENVKNCVNLGWNGVWQFPFTSPFYVWLLENI